jgi:phosphoglycerate dehydrogenase-like enzyme
MCRQFARLNFTQKRKRENFTQVIITFLHSQNYDAIIVRSDTKITADVLASGASGKLKVVGRAGVGIDNIDVEAATKNNVVVLK